MHHSKKSAAVSGSLLERNAALMSSVVHLRTSFRAGAFAVLESEGCVLSKTLDPSRVYAVVRTDHEGRQKDLLPGVYQSWEDSGYEVLGGVYSHSRIPCWFISAAFEEAYRSDPLILRICSVLKLEVSNLSSEDAIWLILQIMG